MSQWQFFLRQAPLYFSHASGYWADNVMKFLEAIWFSWESPKHQLKHFTHFKRVLIAISMIWSLPWDHFSSWLFWWLEKLGDVRNSYFPTQQVLDFFFFVFLLNSVCKWNSYFLSSSLFCSWKAANWYFQHSDGNLLSQIHKFIW